MLLWKWKWYLSVKKWAQTENSGINFLITIKAVCGFLGGFWNTFLPNVISEVWSLLDSLLPCSDTLCATLTHRAAHFCYFLRPPLARWKFLEEPQETLFLFFCELCFTIRFTAEKRVHSSVHPVQSTNLDRTRTFFSNVEFFRVFKFFCVLHINCLLSQQAYTVLSFGSNSVIILFLKHINLL